MSDTDQPVATQPACLCGLDTNPVASPRMDIHCPKHDAPEAGGEPELLPDQVVAMIKESVDCEYGDLVGYKARLGAALVDLKLLLDARVSSAPELDIANSAVALDGNRYSLPAPQVEGAPPLDWWSVEEAEGLANGAIGKMKIPEWRAMVNDIARALEHERARVSQPADWLRDNEIKRLTDERNQLAQQGAELWERVNTAQPAGEPGVRDDIQPWLTAQCSRLMYGQCTTARCAKRGGWAGWAAGARFDPAMATCEAYEVSNALAQPSPTPADEAHAREIVDAVNKEFDVTPSGDDSCWAEYDRGLVARITTALAEARRAQRMCTWTCEPAPDIEMWETDCGNAFQFEVGGPTENKMKFCAFCGKSLVEATKEGEGDG